MNRPTAFCIGVAVLFIYATPTLGTTTNAPAPNWEPYPTNKIYLLNTNRSFDISERYCQELIAGSYRYYDRFGPPSYFNWTIAIDRENFGIHRLMTLTGRDTIKSIVLSSMRETAVNLLPVDDFKEDSSNLIFGFLGRFFQGSLGNTEEIDTSLVGAQPSYHTLKQLVDFSWQSADGEWNGSYGWRPFRDTPYIYLNNNIGHSFNRQLLRTEIRCYGYLRSDDFGLIKVEAQATLTTGRRSHLVLGGRIYPNDMDSEEHLMEGSVRYEATWYKGIVSIGASGTQNERFYSALYTLDF
jgi:hypothetical protein